MLPYIGFWIVYTDASIWNFNMGKTIQKSRDRISGSSFCAVPLSTFFFRSGKHHDHKYNDTHLEGKELMSEGGMDHGYDVYVGYGMFCVLLPLTPKCTRNVPYFLIAEPCRRNLPRLY